VCSIQYKRYTYWPSDSGVIISLEVCKEIMPMTSSCSEKNMGGVCSVSSCGKHSIGAIVSYIHFVWTCVTYSYHRQRTNQSLKLWQVYCSLNRSNVVPERSIDTRGCVTMRTLHLSHKFKYRVIRNDCRGFNNLSYTIHLVLQMQPHVISSFGVTSRIRFMFLLFPQVSRN